MSQYPKPLSAKSVDKLYASAGISPKKRDFITRFFTACSALYGCIDISYAWNVYKELSEKTETVKLKRKDLADAAAILRREEMPFQVYEIDEIYSEEPRTALERTIINKELLPGGYGKFRWVYRVAEAQVPHPYYVPKNMLEYTERNTSEAGQALEKFIGSLVVGFSEYDDPYFEGKKRKCCGEMGKRLDSFSYVSDWDSFLLKDLSGESGRIKPRPKELQALKEEIGQIASVRLMKSADFRLNVGVVNHDESLKYLLNDLNELGVDFGTDAKLLEELITLYTAFNNKTRFWTLCGWTSEELMALYDRPVTEVSFGPGVQKAIRNGDMDEEELRKAFEARGLRIVK